MTYLLSYDISLDKTRTKLADELEIIGLTRIQKSVFSGKASKKLFWKLIQKYEEKLEEEDKLFVWSLADQQFMDMYDFGFEEDKDLILDRKHTLVL